MKYKLLFLIAVVGLVSACGSNKGIHKKHHGKLKWVKVDVNDADNDIVLNVESKVDNEEENSDEAVKENISTEVSNETEDIKTEQNVLSESNTSKTAKKEDLKANEVSKQVAQKEKKNLNKLKKAFVPPIFYNKNITLKAKAPNKIKSTNESGVGFILLICLLIALAIVAYFYVRSPFGLIIGITLLLFILVLLIKNM